MFLVPYLICFGTILFVIAVAINIPRNGQASSNTRNQEEA
jgi:hypothetical protein